VLGVVAVVERNGRLLLIQRAQGIAAGGCWCFPGGAVEPGEHPEVALAREMQEELHLEVVTARFLWQWAREDGRLTLQWWHVHIREAVPVANPAEVQDWRWLTPREVRSLPNLLPNNLAFLDFYEQSHAGNPVSPAPGGRPPPSPGHPG
jgi:8-oxo-dGTP diphosphatase